MPVIYPGPGEEKALAQQLLNMAERARDVKVITDTLGNTHVAFEVPQELADRYLEAVAALSKATEEVKPAPKRRGRPRKQQPVEEPKVEENEDLTEDEDDEKDPDEE